MKKFRIFAAVILAVSVICSLCCVGVSADNGNLSYSLSSDGEVLTDSAGERYVALDLCQFYISIDEKVWSDNQLLIYSVVGDSNRDILHVGIKNSYYEIDGTRIYCRESKADEIANSLSSFTPSNRYGLAVSSYTQLETVQLDDAEVDALLNGPSVKLDYSKLMKEYYSCCNIVIYDQTGVFSTSVGEVWVIEDDGQKVFYYIDYRKISGVSFNYDGSVNVTFGSVADAVLLDEKTAGNIIAKDTEHHEEYYDELYDVGNGYVTISDSRVADIIALVLSIILFGLIPLAVIVMGVVFILRRSRMTPVWVVMMCASVLVIAALVTILILVI